MRYDIASIESATLFLLTPSEVTLKYRFKYQAGFSCSVTQAGLEELLNSRFVSSVEPVRILRPMLAQGLPLMNALATRLTYTWPGNCDRYL